MFWIIPPIISCLSFGIQATITYYLSAKKNFGAVAINSIYHILFVLISLFVVFIGMFFNKAYFSKIITDFFTICTKFIFLASIAAICGLAGNSLLNLSYAAGPDINPGIMTSLGNGAIIIAIVLPFIFFNKKINVKQIIGIAILLFSFAMLADDKFKGFGALFRKK